jgi:hypothetical protein
MTRSITNILKNLPSTYSRLSLKEEAGRFFRSVGNVLLFDRVLYAEEDARYSDRGGNINVHIHSSLVV